MQLKKYHYPLFIICFFALFSCGYHLGYGGNGATISIPYIEGDKNGNFTNTLIREINQSTSFRYLNKNSEVYLKICILETSDDQIGYQRYLLKDFGTFSKNLRPSEGRRKMKVEATLIQTATEQELWGPFVFSSEADYDYVDQDSVQDLAFYNPVTKSETTVLQFSLGQLEPVDNAADAAMIPLYQQLSQKIVDAISAGW